MTMQDLAAELARLGAVTAIAFDGGGSTTLAFDGKVLNSPSDGRERAVGDALLLLYYGVYAPPPRVPVLSPNGDGVAERQRLTWKVVRASNVTVRLVGPGGKVAWKSDDSNAPGVHSVPADATEDLAEGRWRFTVTAVDDQGERSTSERAFTVNKTLGFLTFSSKKLVLAKQRPASLGIGFRLAHDAKVLVVVEGPSGNAVRTLLSGDRAAGDVELRWDGRGRGGRLVPAGPYRVHVSARNRLGTVGLTSTISVERHGRR